MIDRLVRRVRGLLGRVRLRIKQLIFDGIRRDRWQAPERVVAALELRAGHRVVDLGSGTGYFTLRLARAVGPDGVVYAVDTDRELLDLVAERAASAGLGWIRPLPADEDEPSLPEPVDVVFISHVYHHLPDRPTYFARLASSLRDGGRVAILEGRPISRWSRWWGHVTEPAEIRREMAAAGYRLVAEHSIRREESFQVFERAETKPLPGS